MRLLFTQEPTINGMLSYEKNSFINLEKQLNVGIANGDIRFISSSCLSIIVILDNDTSSSTKIIYFYCVIGAWNYLLVVMMFKTKKV